MLKFISFYEIFIPLYIRLIISDLLCTDSLDNFAIFSFFSPASVIYYQ